MSVLQIKTIVVAKKIIYKNQSVSLMFYESGGIKAMEKEYCDDL